MRIGVDASFIDPGRVGGAEHMLGYAAADVVNTIMPADNSDFEVSPEGSKIQLRPC